MNPSSAFRHILGGVVLVASVWGSGCLPAVAAQEVSVSPPPVAATEIVASMAAATAKRQGAKRADLRLSGCNTR